MAINVLPPDTAAKIAAGEVVERPVSVAKELIENSLDFGASRIDIELRAGGVALLRVVDNGSGISAADVPLAFHRYATSKLASADDLERITTHGFRGEALPSIASVADVTLLTRPPEEMGGTLLRIAGGHVLEQVSRGAPPGTSVTVRDLFQNVPARLKFLRSNNAEAGRIATLVGQFALANPGVRFSLAVDGRAVFESSGDGDLRQVAAQVYGLAAAEDLLPVRWQDSASALPLRVTGLMSPPALSRSNPSYITLFVNRRLVQNRSLTFATVDAYQGLLMTGRYPIAVLNLEIDPTETDINVHPSKAEIKFRDEGGAFGAIHKAVKQALTETGLARPAQTSLTPALHVAGDPQLRPVLAGSPLVSLPEPGKTVAPTGQAMPQPAGRAPQLPMPVLRPMGQVGRTYIVAEGPDGMYLIDQHAAHERVLFDRFRKERAKNEVQVQGLLEPAVAELTPQQAALIEAQRATLESYGFSIEAFGQRSVLIRALPATLMPKGPVRALVDLLDTLGSSGLEGYSWDDRILTTLACHSAVRAGHDLGPQEMEQIIRLLEATDNPRTCPRGRPTMLHMSSAQLEREFGRR